MNKSILLSLVILHSSLAFAGNWPQWRGPYSNGSANEKNLPATISPTEDVKWSVDLPGTSASTPIVWDHYVFLTATEKDSSALHALCLDGRDGTILWKKQVSTVSVKVTRNNLASPSPVTDGKQVFFLFGTGDLAAFDFSGKLLWSSDLAKDHGPLNLQFGYSSSPALYEDKLYICVLRKNTRYSAFASQPGPLDSFFLALDAKTAKVIFRHQRPTDAINESLEAYTTPIVYRGKKRTEIILAGGDYVTGHDPDTGKEFWRFGYNPTHKDLQRLIPSPVPGPGLIYAVEPRGSKYLFAIKEGATGTIDWSELAWNFTGPTPDVCTPLLYQNRLYVLDGNRKTMTCLNPQTGENVWQEKIGTSCIFRASPTGADNKIYCINEDGETVVLAAGDEFKILSRASFDSKPTRASVVAANGCLFVHTADKLYCISN
ncbi:MAG: PQQ-binding-like beta-propeller repeat protein [Sedimentisphaerales bacterium]|nr:PQQ-binding-like beta-propeller repeat protein [Sedimentisphaerales bacterium]